MLNCWRGGNESPVERSCGLQHGLENQRAIIVNWELIRSGRRLRLLMRGALPYCRQHGVDIKANL